MSIKKDASIYIFGSLVSKAIPFLIIPYLTNILGVESYGQLTIAISVSSFIICFTLFSLDTACVRYYYRYRSRNDDSILLISIFISSLLFLPIFILLNVFYNDEVYIYASLVSFFQSVFTILISKFNFQKKALKFILFQVFNSVVSFFLTFLYFKMDEASVINRLSAVYLSYAILSLYMLLGFKDNLWKKIRNAYKLSVKFSLYALSFGFPLLLHNISFALKGNFDRLLINEYFTSDVLGIYSLGAQLASILGVLILSVNKASIPYIYEGIKNKNINSKVLTKFSLLSYLLSLFFSFLVYFIPDNLFSFIFGSGFIGVSHYFSLFSLSVFLSIPYLISVNYLFYYGRTRIIAVFNIISTVLYLMLVYFFASFGIEYIPLSGVLSSILLSSLVIFVVRGHDFRENKS